MRTKYICVDRLVGAGIDMADAIALRRIAMTLHRWFELECGVEQGCIERDEATGKPYWLNSLNERRTPMRDMEKGAMIRLAKIMARYPALGAYIQTDPRGASLYILRRGDVPLGASPDAYYNRGLAVHR